MKITSIEKGFIYVAILNKIVKKTFGINQTAYREFIILSASSDCSPTRSLSSLAVV